MSCDRPRPGQLWHFDYGGPSREHTLIFTVLVIGRVTDLDAGGRTWWTVWKNEDRKFTTVHWPDKRWKLLSDA